MYAIKCSFRLSASSQLLSLLGMGLLLLVMAPQAHAWGSIGHRVIGQVADADLTPEARLQVSKIMGTNSLGDVANWMDQIRETPQGKKMKPWHYQSINTCEPPELTCADDQCAGPQIDKAIEALKTRKGNQLKALRVLVHLVGDIHQPLHAAENGGDRGANYVIVKNRFCVDYKTKQTIPCNLHTYWDNMMVKAAMEKAAKGDEPEKDFVNALSSLSSGTEGGAQTWIDQSHALAKSTAHNYEGFACKVGKNTVSVTEDYDTAAVKAVTAQLAAAGHRLARILNDIYR